MTESSLNTRLRDLLRVLDHDLAPENDHPSRRTGGNPYTLLHEARALLRLLAPFAGRFRRGPVPTWPERLQAAWFAYRMPERLSPPLPHRNPEDVPVPAGHMAVALYDHWHPGGRTLFGFLVVDARTGVPHSFVPDVCPAYGVAVEGVQLQRALARSRK